MKKFALAIVAVIIVILFTTNASAEMYLGKMADYGYHNACAIFSATNCINKLGTSQVNLEDVIPVAEECGWDSSKGGMTFMQAESFAKAIAPNGVKTKGRQLDCESLVYVLSEGYTVTIAVDSAALWNGTSFHTVDHLIAVLGVTDEGNFSIVDSGLGFETMTMEQLESCTGDIIYGISFHLTEC